MLRISDEQMDVFRESLERRHEEELFQHACSTYPDHPRLFGKDCVRRLVRTALQKAGRHALVSDTAHRLLLRLILECGAEFDSDPVLGFPGQILGGRTPEPERLAELAAAADRYSGKTAPGLRAAAANFRGWRTDWSGPVSREEYSEALRFGCFTLFPEKAGLAPATAWPGLVEKATAAATERGWRTLAAHAVLFALHFLGGAGVLVDPRFDFIQSVAPAGPATDPGVVLHQTAVKEFERWFAPSA